MDFRKYEVNRKLVARGAAVIMGVITLLSCLSSYQVYRLSFADFGEAQDVLGAVATVAVEGAFVWTVFAFRNVFSSALERFIALVAIGALLACMGLNITTHAMMAKKMELSPFQMDWTAYGAVATLVAILILVLALSLADTAIRIMRSELRFEGRKAEVQLRARTEALHSPDFVDALTVRAQDEVAEMMDVETAPQRHIGFNSTLEEPERRAGFMASGVTVEKSPSVTGNRKARKLPKPPAPDGYFWRGDGKGFQLRRNTYVNGVRKQPYIAYMSAEELTEMRRAHRGKSLDAAIQNWVRNHDK